MKAVLIAFIACLITPTLCHLSKKDYGNNLYEGALKSHFNCKLYTGATDEQINDVLQGKFNDNEPSIQRYTFCLWRDLGELDDNFRLIEPKLLSYLTDELTKQDAKHYLGCNNMALKLAEKDPVKKIWEMQKCIHKNIPPERYIFF